MKDYDLIECLLILLDKFFSGENVKSAKVYYLTRIPVAILLAVIVIATIILFEIMKEEHGRLTVFVFMSWVIILLIAYIYKTYG